MTEQDLNEFFVPRLQIKCDCLGEDYTETRWHYDMVYRHFEGHIVYISLGYSEKETTRTELPLNEKGLIELPYRNGVCIESDALQLRLPAFAICGDVVQRLSLLEFKRKFPERY
ncbi:hypothetical protein BSK59_13245 [Paenibacillus odorifer]|uniref:hypothetical protein n=1 Tax=Paenibacillus odorifer TaxID=189426 RepID=UPI00096E9436|nr:hypothetical protein [Paenibacillus odorifer]OME55437.1 hypothetical protein BSK59_13245 [Paenibacillus odorifer]